MRPEEVTVCHGCAKRHKVVNAGERLCQIVIVPYIAPELEIADELSDTERGEKGFGSTGR